MKYVILGAGPAGVIAAETLVKADPQGQVTLVGGEASPPYSRMAIPYVLTGKIEASGTYLRKTAGYLDGLGIKYIQDRATAVDAGARTVSLASGATLDFDKLLVATGSSPIAPPVPGLDLEGVHHCWTLEDAEKIAARAKPGAHVVLMGAGFIGCIILESLVERGVKLTVVEAEDRMIPKMMNTVGGDMLARWIKTHNVTLKTSTKVTSVAQNGAGLTVSTDKGDSLDADLLVVATGVKPNADFLSGSGIHVEDGIMVNDKLESAAPGIFAAGDVAEGPDFGGGFAVHAVQPTSVDHGRIAALNMTGQNVTYQGSLIMNVLDTLGLISASFGDWSGSDDIAEKIDTDRFLYTKLVFDGDCLTGALSLGRTNHIGVLRGLIQSRIALGPWKQRLKENPSLIADAYVACTQG